MNIEIGADFGTILAVLMGLFLFGIGYNSLVAWMERKGYTEGFLSLIVAFGVTVTLVGVAILSIHAALITLGAFIASGTPMIIGSIVRYLRKREEMKRSIIEEIEK
jgi:membrane protein YdbS with pleckstrin-like domain